MASTDIQADLRTRTGPLPPAGEAQNLRRIIALLRITVGFLLLAVWFNNLRKGIYTAEGIIGLFNYIFVDNGGGLPLYKDLINATILQVPGLFAIFQLVAELMMGLGLFFGFLTPIAGLGATIFFFNLFLAFLGGEEWIGTYILLTASAFVVALTRSGRAIGLDAWLVKTRGEPPIPFLW